MLVDSSSSQPESEMDLISGSTGRQGLQLLSLGSRKRPKGTVMMTQSSIARFLKSLSRQTQLQTQRWFRSSIVQKSTKQRWTSADSDWPLPQYSSRTKTTAMNSGTVAWKQVRKSPSPKKAITLKLFTLNRTSPMLSTNNLQRYKQIGLQTSSSHNSMRATMKPRHSLVGVLCSAKKELSAIQATRISSKMKLNPQVKQLLMFLQFSVFGAQTLVLPLLKSPHLQITNCWQEGTTMPLSVILSKTPLISAIICQSGAIFQSAISFLSLEPFYTSINCRYSLQVRSTTFSVTFSTVISSLLQILKALS